MRHASDEGLRISTFSCVHRRRPSTVTASIVGDNGASRLSWKPLAFTGKKLTLNFSTSAAGSIRVELQRPDGKPIPGFSLADCQEVFDDELERTITWKGGSDLSKLSGQPIRLRFALRDADLFSFQFGE